MLQSAPTTHFEVIDAQDNLVGDLKHSTAAQAGLLRDALVGGGHNGLLRVARVTERMTVQRLIDPVHVEPQKVPRTNARS
ncbi:hypothetical protein [Sphingomonas abaci]|uniref:Uncharacterized protein n=1 Tax=Sphingomonas abaci TaxID=237611 RepID=A0A7W7ALL2_9SPHN|nr:hypothetical protein [Sphingomonas abaci]MBB4619136.1 hypothetical protein [Sphingomonas abaci]